MMEKEIGTSVQVVNKPGGTNQVAANELIAAKPDGYNLMMVSIPSSLVTYLDPDRKAAYARKDFHPVAGAFADGLGVIVKADSPFKTVKDVVDAAKANPGKVSTSTAGILGLNHLGGVAWEQNAGMRLAYVHFDGGAPQMTALLGGHTDVGLISLGNVRAAFKSGTVRVLGIMDKQENELFPGVPTLESQGYKTYASLMYAATGPAGLQKDVVDVLNAAIKKVATSAEYKTRVNEIGMVPRYLDAEGAAGAWADGEAWAKPLLDIAKKQ
jgi:tripartite-type tricarboxylate transporter receptor subunit TctC